jgi:hypothetical protein
MAGQELNHEGPAADRNNLSLPHQHSFNNHDFRDYSFESSDYWTFQEPFFDIPDEELPTLSVSDVEDLTSAITGDVHDNSHMGQSEPHDPNLQAVGQMDPVDVDEGYQDLAPPMDDLESVGVSELDVASC